MFLNLCKSAGNDLCLYQVKNFHKKYLRRLQRGYDFCTKIYNGANIHKKTKAELWYMYLIHAYRLKMLYICTNTFISPAYKHTFISLNHIICNTGCLKQSGKRILQLS